MSIYRCRKTAQLWWLTQCYCDPVPLIRRRSHFSSFMFTSRVRHIFCCKMVHMCSQLGLNQVNSAATSKVWRRLLQQLHANVDSGVIPVLVTETVNIKFLDKFNCLNNVLIIINWAIKYTKLKDCGNDGNRSSQQHIDS